MLWTLFSLIGAMRNFDKTFFRIYYLFYKLSLTIRRIFSKSKIAKIKSLMFFNICKKLFYFHSFKYWMLLTIFIGWISFTSNQFYWSSDVTVFYLIYFCMFRFKYFRCKDKLLKEKKCLFFMIFMSWKRK